MAKTIPAYRSQGRQVGVVASADERGERAVYADGAWNPEQKVWVFLAHCVECGWVSKSMAGRFQADAPEHVERWLTDSEALACSRWFDTVDIVPSLATPEDVEDAARTSPWYKARVG